MILDHKTENVKQTTATCTQDIDQYLKIFNY